RRPVDTRISRARGLRHETTEAERKLWPCLKQIALNGSHFRRQATIGPYFADFACHALRIVIEIDGGQHNESASDAARTRYLEALGYRVLRFWNNDVLNNAEGVAEVIAAAIAERIPPPPPAASGGRGVETNA
ncbi:MAG: endonuclease domain-containing protein, partial [Afipia sp.]|nr:endonuclease domain-containing protein [Afipia sp.]